MNNGEYHNVSNEESGSYLGDDPLHEEYEQLRARLEKRKSWTACAFAFFLHKKTVAGIFVSFAIGMAITSGIAAGVGWERDAVRSVMGEDLDIAYKQVWFRSAGWMLVWERHVPGRVLQTSEIVRNNVSASKVKQRLESTRFNLAAAADAAKFQAEQLSHTREYAGTNLDDLDDQEFERTAKVEPVIDLSDAVPGLRMQYGAESGANYDEE